VRRIGLDAMLANSRPKDLADVAVLEENRRRRG
jgi:hypothetical protein